MIKKLLSFRKSGIDAAVSVYRTMGFVFVFLIIFTVIGYLFSAVFFVINSGWGLPMVLSPDSERVVSLGAKYAQNVGKRDELSSQLLALTDDLKVLEIQLSQYKNYKERFARNIEKSVDIKLKGLDEITTLVKRYEDLSGESVSKTKRYSSSTKKELNASYKSGLVNKRDYIDAQYALLRLEFVNLDFAGKLYSLQNEKQEVEYDLKGLQALLSYVKTGFSEGLAGVGNDVMTLQQQYDQTILQVKRLESEKRQIIQRRVSIANSIDQFDKVLDRIVRSPLYLASKDDVSVAFVPYKNLDSMVEGVGIYGCSFGLIWCSKIGTVSTVLPGEISADHPFFNRSVRGLMVYMKMEASDSAEHDIVHFGSRPPFFI